MYHEPRTTKTHDLYALALRDRDMLPVLAIGTAGTGKTFGAVQAAVEWLQRDHSRQFVGIRPNVSFAEKSGFLPGTEREKLEPWVRPLLQNFAEAGMGRSDIEYNEKKGRINFFPLEHIQGMTFHNAFIVVDECQNMSFEQLRVMLTRQGRWSKVVLCGDVAQTSPKFHQSGLPELLKMIDHFNGRIHHITFTKDDIMRSEQCAKWIEMFEEWDKVKEGL